MRQRRLNKRGTPGVRPYPRRWGSATPSTAEVVGAGFMVIGSIITIVVVIFMVLFA